MRSNADSKLLIDPIPNDVMQHEILPRLSTRDMVSILLTSKQSYRNYPSLFSQTMSKLFGISMTPEEVKKEEIGLNYLVSRMHYDGSSRRLLAQNKGNEKLIRDFPKVAVCILENDLTKLKKMDFSYDSIDWMGRDLHVLSHYGYTQPAFEHLVAKANANVRQYIYDRINNINQKATFHQYFHFQVTRWKIICGLDDQAIFCRYFNTQNNEANLYYNLYTDEELFDLFLLAVKHGRNAYLPSLKNYLAIRQEKDGDDAVKRAMHQFLIIAFSAGNIDAIMFLKECKGFVDFPSVALHEACQSGSVAGYDYYMTNKSDPNVNLHGEKWGYTTPLVEAVKKGHKLIVNRLLERADININFNYEAGLPALHCAVEHAYLTGSCDVLDMILQDSRTDINGCIHPLYKAGSYDLLNRIILQDSRTDTDDCIHIPPGWVKALTHLVVLIHGAISDSKLANKSAIKIAKKLLDHDINPNAGMAGVICERMLDRAAAKLREMHEKATRANKSRRDIDLILANNCLLNQIRRLILGPRIEEVVDESVNELNRLTVKDDHPLKQSIHDMANTVSQSSEAEQLRLRSPLASFAAAVSSASANAGNLQESISQIETVAASLKSDDSENVRQVGKQMMIAGTILAIVGALMVAASITLACTGMFAPVAAPLLISGAAVFFTGAAALSAGCMSFFRSSTAELDPPASEYNRSLVVAAL